MCKPTYKQIDKLVSKGKKFKCVASVRVNKDEFVEFESCKDIDKLIKTLKKSKENLRDTLWMIHHCSYKHVMHDIANMNFIMPPHICPHMVYRSP